MQRFNLLLVVVTAVLCPSPSHADRTYKVYKANEFGRRSLSGSPDAVIKVDEFTGEAKVYEPNIFGEADILEGPKYIIESESPLFGHHHHSDFDDRRDSCDERHHTHQEDENTCIDE